MRKQVFNSVASILIVAVFVLGSYQSALAQTVSDKGWEAGRQGVFMPGGLNQNNVTVTQIDKEDADWAPVRFHRKLLNLQFKNDAGSTVDTPFVMTYVFFNLNGRERALWDQGDLGIWYWDKSTNAWRECNSFLVNAPGTQGTNNEDNEGSGSGQGHGASGGRVTCLATQFTTFGLGSSQSE